MDVQRNGNILEDRSGELMEEKKSDLIALKPSLYSDFVCPNCSTPASSGSRVYFSGIHVMGGYACISCGIQYERDLPIGFANDHPLAVNLADKTFYNTTNAPDWLTGSFLINYHDRTDDEVKVNRIVYKAHKEVIILNCLDFLYGHVLLKLYNAQHYLDAHPDKGLIIIAPKMYSWMIPAGVAEYWEVELGLSKLQRWRNKFNNLVQIYLKDFDTVFLGRGYSHPEFHKIDITRYIDVPAFPIEEFATRPLHVTFVARQDRLWFRTPASKFVYRVLNKLGLKRSLGSFFISAQNRMMRQVIQQVKKAVPNATFTVVGLGKPSCSPKVAFDLRTKNMNAAVERSWCKAYGQSQVVIGVHGSNMLLPTAFAGGCVEILPHDRNGNIVQDISVKYADRMQLFMYRFVDEFASPATVARTTIAMYRDYPIFNNNNRLNIF